MAEQQAVLELAQVALVDMAIRMLMAVTVAQVAQQIFLDGQLEAEVAVAVRALHTTLQVTVAQVELLVLAAEAQQAQKVR